MNAGADVDVGGPPPALPAGGGGGGGVGDGAGPIMTPQDYADVLGDDDGRQQQDGEGDDALRAQATAEVEAMEGNQRGGGGGGNRAGEEALMGANAVGGGDGDGVRGFEVADESGELVMQRFLQFLSE